MKNKILDSRSDFKKWGILSGVGQAVFIGVMILFVTGVKDLSEQLLGGFANSFLFFVLFFLSCAIISVLLVFGRPIYLLLSKNYAEATATLLLTVLTLVVVTGVFLLFLFF